MRRLIWILIFFPVISLGRIIPCSSIDSGYARSENVVVFAPSQKLADQVVKKAEILRKKIALEWFGKELPKGQGMVSINIRLAGDADQGDTWITAHPSTAMHVMRLSTTGEVVPTALEHEMGHVVINTMLGDLPRWFEEGVSCCYDDARHRQQTYRFVNEMARTNTLPNFRSFLTEKSRTLELADGKPYPVQRAYAVSHSIIDFLLELGEKKTLINFIKDGKSGNYNEALQIHYKIKNLDELQRRWQIWLTKR